MGHAARLRSRIGEDAHLVRQNPVPVAPPQTSLSDPAAAEALDLQLDLLPRPDEWVRVPLVDQLRHHSRC